MNPVAGVDLIVAAGRRSARVVGSGRSQRLFLSDTDVSGYAVARVRPQDHVHDVVCGAGDDHIAGVRDRGVRVGAKFTLARHADDDGGCPGLAALSCCGSDNGTGACRLRVAIWPLATALSAVRRPMGRQVKGGAFLSDMHVTLRTVGPVHTEWLNNPENQRKQ